MRSQSPSLQQTMLVHSTSSFVQYFTLCVPQIVSCTAKDLYVQQQSLYTAKDLYAQQQTFMYKMFINIGIDKAS
jgi:hypothetical protein